MCIFATLFGTISFLAVPGYTYSSDWNDLVGSPSLPEALIIGVKYFEPPYRKINSPSGLWVSGSAFGSLGPRLRPHLRLELLHLYPYNAGRRYVQFSGIDVSTGSGALAAI